MMANRVREFRVAAGLTQEKLAELTGLSHTHVQRIETGKRGLSVPIALRFVKALGKPLEEILGMATTSSNAVRRPGANMTLNEDAEPYVAKPGQRLRLQPSKGENIDPWLIKTEAVSRTGIRAGQVRFVDISAEAVENIKPLQCAMAQVYGGGADGKTITVVRQFVPPSLLITNSDTVTEMPLDIDKGEAYIKGVIIDDFTISS